MTRLAELVTLQRGQSYKSSYIGEPGPVLLGLGTIRQGGGFRDDILRTYGGPTPDHIRLHGGDLYASLKDVTYAAELLGAVARVPKHINQARLTQDTVRIDIVSDLIDIEYLHWALRSPSYRAYCKSRGTGTTNLDLSRDDFFAYDVRTPPLPEQQAIAEVLGALDDKIAANTRLADIATDALETEAEARWFRSGTPRSPLTTFLETNPRTIRPIDDEPVYVDMKALPERGAGITDWTTRAPKGGARFANGDTLVARITPCLENRKTGYVDILDEGEVGIGSTEFIVFRPRNGFASPIGYFIAVSGEFRDFAIQHMVGSSGRQRVSATDLERYELPNPDPEWLADFSRRASATFDHLKSLRAENRTLATTRDALLPQLMSGRLRVRDIEQSVAKAGL